MSKLLLGAAAGVLLIGLAGPAAAQGPATTGTPQTRAAAVCNATDLARAQGVIDDIQDQNRQAEAQRLLSIANEQRADNENLRCAQTLAQIRGMAAGDSGAAGSTGEAGTTPSTGQ